MKIISTEKTFTDRHFNSFGQLVTEAPESYTSIEVIGTLEEIIEYSRERDVCVKRSAATKSLFPAWDSISKWAFITNGKADYFVERLQEISNAQKIRTAKGTIEEGGDDA